MHVSDRVHVVASGSSGLDLTDPFDAHAYLVDGGREAALIDAGCGADPGGLLDRIRATGVSLDRVRRLALTHAHPDHTGGAAALKAALNQLTVTASPTVAGWVRAADEEAMSLEAGKRAAFYRPDFAFAACPVEDEVRDGDRVRVGEVTLEALATPGHADGHVAFLLDEGGRRTLFGGDLVFYGGRISLLNTWDCRVQAYAASMAALRDARVDALLPGHHEFSLRGGQRHIDTANRLFDRGFVPPSIV